MQTLQAHEYAPEHSDAFIIMIAGGNHTAYTHPENFTPITSFALCGRKTTFCPWKNAGDVKWIITTAHTAYASDQKRFFLVSWVTSISGIQAVTVTQSMNFISFFAGAALWKLKTCSWPCGKIKLFWSRRVSIIILRSLGTNLSGSLFPLPYPMAHFCAVCKKASGLTASFLLRRIFFVYAVMCPKKAQR